MEKVKLTKEILRKGLNSRNFRREVINYNKLIDKEEDLCLDFKEKFKKRKRNGHADLRTSDKYEKGSMKKLNFIKKRGFF